MTLLFSLFFSSTRRWLVRFNEILNPSFWLVSDLSFKTTKFFSYLYSTRRIKIKRSFWTNSRGNVTIFGRKWYQICAKSKAKEGDWTVLRKTDLLAVLPIGYGKSLIYQLLICFLADGLNIFPQAFIATDLPHVTFILPGKLYKHRYNCFLFGPAASRFSQRPTVFKF